MEKFVQSVSMKEKCTFDTHGNIEQKCGQMI